MTVNWEPFITCAVTGAGDTAHKHPGLPITPEQIAAAAVEAAHAGAAVVHLHVRDPDTGRGSRRLDLFRETVELVRASDVDVLINLTAGMGGELVVGSEGAANTPAPGSDFVGAAERIEHVLELRPDLCSLDCGSMNYDDDSSVYVMPVAYLRETAKALAEVGVKPELETFDLGHVELAKQLISEGLVEGPPLIQVCLGVANCAPASTAAMAAMVNLLPADAVWSGFAVGRMELAMAGQAMLLGGNIRVGLEDNLYLSRGVLASNGDLVRRAVEIVKALGGQVAGPDTVRQRLGL
jgi:3-dehydrocarnitine:acetyl-CoA trimethylamine transferase